jgi:hypothetical protein
MITLTRWFRVSWMKPIAVWFVSNATLAGIPAPQLLQTQLLPSWLRESMKNSWRERTCRQVSQRFSRMGSSNRRLSGGATGSGLDWLHLRQKEE